MKKYSKILMSLSFVGLLMSSCSMNVTPTNAEVYDPDESDMITSFEKLQYHINGIYSAFRGTQYGAATMPMEFMCDGFNAAGGFGNNMGPIHRTDDTFRASDYDSEYVWQVNYEAIKDYNVFLEALAKYEPEDEDAEWYAVCAEGEAKFFRAYAYMTLVRHFAKDYEPATANKDLGVPVVLTYDQNAKPARATVKAVYDQIGKDLEDAKELLEECYGGGGLAGYKWVSPDAVLALQARYYLDTHQYEDAMNNALELIISGNYELASDDETMLYEYLYDAGTEAIMQCPGSQSENGSGTNTYYTRFSYMAALKNAGYCSSGVYLNPYFIPSGKLVDLYEGSDLRWVHWFWNGTKSDDDFYGPRCDSRYAARLAGFGWAPYYYARYFPLFTKYIGNPSLQTSSTTPNARQLVKPLLIGEQFLILAEAAHEYGDDALALEALQMLQEYRGATADTEFSEESLQNEWFKETVGEGLRMSCLKRWHAGFNGRYGQSMHAYYGTIASGPDYERKVMLPTDRAWQWPIPSWECRTNENMEQNPGY